MFHSIYNHSFNPPVIDDFLNSNLHFKKVSLNGRQVSNLQYLCRLFLETREQLYAAHEKTETEAIDSIPRAFWIQNAGFFSSNMTYGDLIGLINQEKIGI